MRTAGASKPRRLRSVVLVALLLGVVALALRASWHRSDQPDRIDWLDRAVLRVSAPVQGALVGAGHAVAQTWRGYVWLVDVKHENVRLGDENRRLCGELERTHGDARRVKELEGLLGLRDEVAAETVAARVIGVETSPAFRVVRLRLDRGTDEVRPGMVVLVPEGVVGRVGRVYGRYCDVQLLTDEDSAIDVQVERSGARGVLRGVAGSRRYQAHIPEMARGDDVQAGDRLVASGIGGFPRGMTVGTVASVTRPDSGLWQQVEVAPSVDFDRLNDVLVVLAPPPPPDPDFRAGSPRRAAPRGGLLAPR